MRFFYFGAITITQVITLIEIRLLLISELFIFLDVNFAQVANVANVAQVAHVANVANVFQSIR